MEHTSKAKIAKKNVYAGSGVSTNSNPYKAGQEAVEMAMTDMQKQGADKAPGFGLVFCSGGKYGRNAKMINELVAGAASVFKNIPWAGCTTCGEIRNGDLLNGSCICLLIASDYIRVGIGVASSVHKNARKAGKQAVQNALKNIELDRVVSPYVKYTAQKTKGISELLRIREFSFVVFSPGHTLDRIGSEDQVLNGVQEITGKQSPIIGGTSGDDLRMLTNFQFANGKCYDDAAVVVALSMGVKNGFGFDHGYILSGNTTVVTKSKDYIVETLDSKPALDRYAELLGVRPDQLWDYKSRMFTKGASLAKLASKYFSLAVDPRIIPFLSSVTTNPFGISDFHGNLAIRTAKSVKGKSIEFSQMIPTNVVLHTLKVDPEKVLAAEKRAIMTAVADAGSDPSIILIFDCDLRKVYAGERKIAESIADVKRAYPRAIIFGFNTMGEFTYSRSAEPMANCATVSVGVISNKLLSE